MQHYVYLPFFEDVGKGHIFFVHELLWLCGETVCHGKLVNCVKSIGEVGFVGRG